MVACWFVETDGAGHKGYQAVDPSSSSVTPQTAPIFTNIDDLRVDLKKRGVTNVVSFDQGFTDGGWKIRQLTADELRALK